MSTEAATQNGYQSSSERTKISTRVKNYFRRRRTEKDFIYRGSFHQAMRPVLVIAQCFALMPVRGLRGATSESLSFSWLSFRTFYSLFFLLCLIIDTIITICWYFDQDPEFSHVDTLIFHISTVIVTVTFIRLAKNWPTLMSEWEKVEIEVAGIYSKAKKSNYLSRRIHSIMWLAVVLSTTEHILNMISILHYTTNCPQTANSVESFFRTQLSHIFHFFEYNTAVAVLGKILNIYLTFIWNFMDAFVMIMSVGLQACFKQINHHIGKTKGKCMSNEFWADYRIYYKNACTLCDKVDDAISIITMVSFSNNLFFICAQLLKSLNKMPSFAHALYFYFSLAYLIGRTLAVSLFAAAINDESQRPIEIFRCIPKDAWVAEVKRFADDVSRGLVALSGMKFFYITKKLVLTVVGTIATYELVLIQFHEDQMSLGCGPKQNLSFKNILKSETKVQ